MKLIILTPAGRKVQGCKLWHAADLVAEHGDETTIGKQGPS